MKLPLHASLPAFLALFVGALDLVAADVTGNARVDGTTVYNNAVIRWRPANRSYEIVNGPSTLTFPASRVQLAIPRPRQLDAARADFLAGRNAAVITGLTPILGDYIMLQHDEEIAALLIRAHVAANNSAEAIKVAERVIAARPESAFRGGMVSAYWATLLAAGQNEKLRGFLEKAIQTGDIPAMSQALVMRGDMIVNKANPSALEHRQALVDGYLRVIVLYAKDAKDVLAEALYKAAQSFDKIGQTGRAQNFRNKLQAEFPNSEWAGK